jgi:hypothetical protein
VNTVTELWAGQLVNLDSILDRCFSLRCNVHTDSIAQLTSYPMVTIGSIPVSTCIVAAAAAMKLTRELLIHSHYVFMVWYLSEPSLLTNLLQVCP